MIEGDEITGITINSTWEAEFGPGCELSVELATGRKLYVIRTGLDSIEDEVERWRTERVGTKVVATKEIADWPLADGGAQTTLDIEMEDGFTFEADLIHTPEDPEPVEADEIETEWTFEGTPGTEMGEQATDHSR